MIALLLRQPNRRVRPKAAIQHEDGQRQLCECPLGRSLKVALHPDGSVTAVQTCLARSAFIGRKVLNQRSDHLRDFVMPVQRPTRCGADSAFESRSSPPCCSAKSWGGFHLIHTIRQLPVQTPARRERRLRPSSCGQRSGSRSEHRWRHGRKEPKVPGNG